MYHRLLQNRKSAKKCRLKKKAEFHVMQEIVDSLKSQNKELSDKVSLKLHRQGQIGRIFLSCQILKSINTDWESLITNFFLCDQNSYLTILRL